ncbi:hypothetical protein AB4865_04755 [Capnocytophaga sp. ARDL2]|uniref:hypothetical protein n=1 Tax=Capnocytophaga sp. ARDL2 TaxID=3238809 RepID=UPI0035563976
MAKRLYFTNEEILQNSKVLFETLEKHQQIAEKLQDYGYGSEEIQKGKQLYAQARKSYTTNKQETEDEKIAYATFKALMDTATEAYRTHRGKAKLIFKNNPTAQISLALKGSPAVAILLLIEEMYSFYTKLKADTNLLTPLARLKIATDDVEKQLSNIAQIRDAYANYSQEKNENQQATKDKNKAFDALQEWMRDLYGYAKYALEEEEQFLQIFGKIIR